MKSASYVRCFWAGKMFLTNGHTTNVHCTHISSTQVEIESPIALEGSRKVKLELNAMHEGKLAQLKAICDPISVVLNEHDLHYIKLSFHNINQKDQGFIEDFVQAHQ
ncbi:hypothetical protein Marme_2928 [Marinomonas mediterranea MMB-1]|uniref:Type IV pilus assembly PilZ n=2 Tax=Marinomonas mediterranea TaxID=119864 RepID=F2K0Q8_MARM1|nr:hypothetical protein Marme_2928 [Marinomonas mediterranea MMB-1]WCN19601.1 hypothetical protein GV053_14790 [Marinomonas mediterranea MMB-1]